MSQVTPVAAHGGHAPVDRGDMSMVDDGVAGAGPGLGHPAASDRPAAGRRWVPCAARPGFVHLDARCECFFGGPPPEFRPPDPR